MSVQLISNGKEKRRKFTPQQKLQILKEREATGNGIEVAQSTKSIPKPYIPGREPWNRGLRSS